MYIYHPLINKTEFTEMYTCKMIKELLLVKLTSSVAGINRAQQFGREQTGPTYNGHVCFLVTGHCKPISCKYITVCLSHGSLYLTYTAYT